MRPLTGPNALSGAGQARRPYSEVMMFSKRLSVLALAALVVAPLAARAQDYAVSPLTDAYEGIAAGDGTTLFTDSDDGFKAIDLPFVFRVYGKAYGPNQSAGTRLWVSVNGGVTFAGQDGVTQQAYPIPGINQPIPSVQQPQALLAVLWDDFIATPRAPNGGSRVSWKVVGTAPDRGLVIDWKNVQLYSNYGPTAPTFSFALRLYEGSDQYEVRFGPRTGDQATAPLSATSGLENSQGTTGTNHYTCTNNCTGTQIAAGTSLLISPNLNPELALTLGLDGSGGAGPAVVATITNAGKSGASTSYKLYLSEDAKLDETDTLLYTSPALAVGARPATVTDRQVLALPPTVLGTRYIVGVVDPDNQIPEINKKNNQGASPSFTAGSDLTATLSGPGGAIIGGKTSFVLTVANGGEADATQVGYRLVLSGGDLETPRVLLTGTQPAVAALGSVPLTLDVDVPVDLFPGTYSVSAAVDPDNTVTEVDETNNAAPTALDFDLKGPDVAVGAIAIGARIAYQGQSLPVRVTLQNLGPAKATNFTYSIMLSDNDVITLRDKRAYTSPPLSLDGVSSRVDARSVQLPEDLPLGNYYVGVIVDAEGTVRENDRSNNVRRATDLVRIAAPLPDLTVTSAGSTPVVPAGELARVSALLTNIGAAGAEFDYTVVLSPEGNVSNRDLELARGRTTLAASQQQVLALDARIPATTLPGTYTLGVIVDPDGQVEENDDTNNAAAAPAIEVAAAPITITTPALPDGLVGVPYDVHLAAKGGDGRFTWRLAAGALPNGLSIDPAGRISGTPLAQGASAVTFEAKSGDTVAVAAYGFSIRAYAASLGLLEPRLPPARRGVTYSQPIQAAGGNPPYRFSVSSGTLPTGLTLAADGTVSGLPTAVGGKDPVISVEDNGGHRATGPVHIDVLSEAALALVETRLKEPEAGKAFTQTLTIEGGSPPYAVAVVEHALPPGLALTNADTGLSASIDGTPTSAGVYPFTLSVSDAKGELELAHFVMRVTTRTISFVTVGLQQAVPGEAYEETLEASARPDGSGRFSLVGGELPPGLRLDASGHISGTVAGDAAHRLYAFSVRVEDATGGAATGPFAIDIPLPPPVTPDTSGCATGSGSLLGLALALAMLLGRRRRGLGLAAGLVALVAANPASALYRVSRETGTFTTITGTTIYDSTTDATAKATALPLPFTFNFYGTTQTTVAVSTTGLMSFGSVQTTNANTKLPTGGNPTMFVAPWWDDLKLSSTGTAGGSSLMSWKVEGTAPNRAFVVEWRNMQRSSQSGTGFAAYSFQVRLWEGSNDITLHYGGAGASTGTAPTLTASIGVQGPGADQGLDLSDTLCSPACASSAFPVNGIVRLKLSPDLVVESIQAPSAMFVDADTSVGVHLHNIGGADAQGAKVTFKLSRDLLDDGCIGDPANPALDEGRICEDAVVGTSAGVAVYPNGETLVTTRLRATAAQNLPAGVYNLLAIVDEANTLAEVDESNNVNAGTSIALSPAAPDFVPTRLQGAFAADAGRPYQLTRTIRNNGNKEGTGTFTVVLSANSVATAADTVLEGPTSFTLPPGAATDATVPLTIPAGTAPGKYWIGLVVRPAEGTNELDALNDERVLGPVTVRGGALAITVDQLPDVTAGVPFAIQLTSSGGSGDAHWASGFPAPPAGVSVSPSGVVSGVLDVSGEWPLQVQLTSGGVVASKTYGLRAVGHPVPLALASTRLPNGVVGGAYEARLAAIGGKPPYKWALVAPSMLPNGLVLTEDGVVEGVPLEDGAATFDVKVTDTENTSVSGTVGMAIPGPTRPLFVTTELPEGVAGAAYEAHVAAAGGTQPYRFTVVDTRRIPESGPAETVAGSAPAGLTLADDGTLSGTPTTRGVYVVTFSVKDAHGYSDTAAYALAVGTSSTQELGIRTGTLPDAVVGTPYSLQLVAEGGSGKLTWHAELLEGVAFPTGIEFTDTGRIVGTPGVTGSVGFLAVVTDETGRSASRPLGLRVNDAPVTPVDTSGCSEAGPASLLALVIALLFLARSRRPALARTAARGAAIAVLALGALPACTAAPPPPCGGSCPTGLTCDATDNVCKCGGAGGAVCGDGETCDAPSKTCLAPTCATSCPAGTVCAADGACHCGTAAGPSCAAGDACTALGRCEHRAVCEGVVCSAGMTCDASQQGQCRCGPGGPACKSGERCQDGACTADRCLGVSCTGGTRCDPQDGACKCGGQGGAVCLNGEACDAVEGRCLRSSRCGGVTCPAGEACDPADGACKCGGTGGPLCGADQSCDPVKKTCVGGDLCVGVTCDAGQSCDSEDGTCKCGGFGGVACTAGTTCVADATSRRCVVTCDPLATTTGCGAQEACRYDAAHSTSYCVPAGTGSVGDSCDASNTCAGGLHCVTASGQTRGACRAYCADSNGCDTSLQCNPFVAGGLIGACVPR